MAAAYEKTGHRSRTREANREYQREWRAKNPERVSIRNKRHRLGAQ